MLTQNENQADISLFELQTFRKTLATRTHGLATEYVNIALSMYKCIRRSNCENLSWDPENLEGENTIKIIPARSQC